MRRRGRTDAFQAGGNQEPRLADAGGYRGLDRLSAFRTGGGEVLITIKHKLLFFLIICGAFVLAALNLHAAPQPNIIFILADDIGYGDLSCHGNPILGK